MTISRSRATNRNLTIPWKSFADSQELSNSSWSWRPHSTHSPSHRGRIASTVKQLRHQIISKGRHIDLLLIAHRAGFRVRAVSSPMQETTHNMKPTLLLSTIKHHQTSGSSFMISMTKRNAHAGWNNHLLNSIPLMSMAVSTLPMLRSATPLLTHIQTFLSVVEMLSIESQNSNDQKLIIRKQHIAP